MQNCANLKFRSWRSFVACVKTLDLRLSKDVDNPISQLF